MSRRLSFAGLLAIGIASLTGYSLAQEKSASKTIKLEQGAPPATAKIADMAWLSGRWVGEGLGGTVEEVWSPPLGRGMMGMFRLVKNDKLIFSEHCQLSEVDGSLLLKIKHFDSELKGREEKDVSAKFPLVKLAANEAFFDGLTMKRSDPKALTIWVAIKNKKTGVVREEEFRYRRAKEE